LARAGSRTLARLIQEHDEIHLRPHPEEGTEEITLPANIARLVQDVLEQIGQGQAVVVLPIEAELTTSQAAELIGVSRPHLIKLLESGDIPFHLAGTHRRVRLDSVLTYRRELDRRIGVMQELMRETEALGL
jgi:excisionase family DNA binding protein